MFGIEMITSSIHTGIKVSHGPRHGEGGTGIHFYVDFPNGHRLSIVRAYGTYGIEAAVKSGDNINHEVMFRGEEGPWGWLEEVDIHPLIMMVNSL